MADKAETPEVPTEKQTRNTARKLVAELEKKVALVETQLGTKQAELQRAVNRIAELEHYLRKLTGLQQ